MKKTYAFFKDRIITGIIILVPATILAVLLTDILKKITELTAPLTGKFAVGGPLTETTIAVVIIVLVLLLLFLITGILFKTNPGRQLQQWLQESFLLKIPLYKTLRGITQQLTGVNKGSYPVVEIDLYGSGVKSLGLLTDTLADGRCVVYLPFAPILNIGQVFIVARENIAVVDISLKDASDIITQIGFEAKSVYPPNNEQHQA